MTGGATSRQAGVLGHPITHSLSPVLHRAAYAHLGLVGWTYGAYDVEPDGLAGFLDGLDADWAGLSLTMPLKAAVLPLLDACSPLAQTAGAANTVLLRGGRRVGENTDVPGLVAALEARGISAVPSAVVLGGGATARSAVLALSSLTREVTVYTRDPARRAGLEQAAAGAGVDLVVVPWARAAEGLAAPLVISATSAGATDPLVAAVPRTVGALFEVLYDPWPTPLAAAWLARGAPVLDGLDLLVHQAVRQVALMTGMDCADGDPAVVLSGLLRAAGERVLRA